MLDINLNEIVQQEVEKQTIEIEKINTELHSKIKVLNDEKLKLSDENKTLKKEINDNKHLNFFLKQIRKVKEANLPVTDSCGLTFFCLWYSNY